MSKYKEIQTEFRNVESLKQALSDLGMKFQVAAHPKQNTLTLVNRWAHGNAQCAVMVEEAEVRTASKAAYTFGGVGFAWSGNGYALVQDDLDAGKPERVQLVNRLKQRYGYREIQKQARARGYTAREAVQPDGTIRVTLTRR